MKNLGKIDSPESVTTKKYVDDKNAELDLAKLEEKDFSELTNVEIQALWNQYVES